MENRRRSLERLETDAREQSELANDLETKVDDHRHQVEALEAAFSELHGLMRDHGSELLDKAMAGLDTAKDDLEDRADAIRDKRDKLLSKNREMTQFCQEKYEESLRSESRISKVSRSAHSTGIDDFYSNALDLLKLHIKRMGRLNDSLLGLHERLKEVNI